jgi:hypothetical protein
MLELPLREVLHLCGCILSYLRKIVSVVIIKSSLAVISEVVVSIY